MDPFLTPPGMLTVNKWRLDSGDTKSSTVGMLSVPIGIAPGESALLTGSRSSGVPPGWGQATHDFLLSFCSTFMFFALGRTISF